MTDQERLERRREIGRAHYYRHAKAKRQAWRQANPGKQLEIARKQRQRQRERGVALWNERNPERAKENRRRWKLKNPEQKERARWRERERNHGVTKEQFLELALAQGNVCAICQTVPVNVEQLHIDHDHATGKIRGLLCTNCNPMIGFAKDNPDILKAAILYLAKWKE